MVYLDITTEQERKALAMFEDECDKGIRPKWKEKVVHLLVPVVYYFWILYQFGKAG